MRNSILAVALILVAGLFGFARPAEAGGSTRVYVDLGDIFFAYDQPYYRDSGELLAVSYYYGKPRYYRHGHGHRSYYRGHGYRPYGRGYRSYGHSYRPYGHSYRHGYRSDYRHGSRHGGHGDDYSYGGHRSHGRGHR